VWPTTRVIECYSLYDHSSKANELEMSACPRPCEKPSSSQGSFAFCICICSITLRYYCTSKKLLNNTNMYGYGWCLCAEQMNTQHVSQTVVGIITSWVSFILFFFWMRNNRNQTTIDHWSLRSHTKNTVTHTDKQSDIQTIVHFSLLLLELLHKNSSLTVTILQ